MKFVLIVSFSIISFCLTYSQDKIIFTSGKERKCTIISEDSLNVKAILKKDGKETTAIISRNYIQSIKYNTVSKTRKRIILSNGTILDGTIIRDDSASLSVNILESGLEKSLFISKSMIKSIDTPKDIQNTSELSLSNKDITNSFSISIGPSIPFGNYSESVWIYTGHANIGVNVAANLSIGLNTYLNIGLKSFALINSLDQKNENSFWKSAGILGGLELKIPSDIFDLKFKGFGGMLFIESPEFNFTYDFYNTKFKKVTANCWGYNIGSDINLKTSSKTYFMISLDYLYGYFRFSRSKAIAIKLGTSKLNNGLTYPLTGYAEESIYQEFKVLNINFGVGYYF